MTNRLRLHFAEKVRLDSGDLGEHARRVRNILDAAGLHHVIVFASGGIDEDQLLDLARRNAPIDGYGIGTSLVTSSDVPALDCAYKLQEYAGIPRRKRSEGKATWPGRKQVWRRYDERGTMIGDTLTLAGDPQPGTALLQPAMRNGHRVPDLPDLETARRHAAHELGRLPKPLQQLQAAHYPVEVAPVLRRLADECDSRVAAMA